MTKRLVTTLNVNQQEALRRISRDILGEADRYMTRVLKDVLDRTEAEKRHAWTTLYQDALAGNIRLNAHALYDTASDVTQYGYRLLQENVDDDTLEGVRHLLALLDTTGVLTTTAKSMIPRDRPLRDLVLPATPCYVAFQRIDKRPFLDMTRRLLNDDSITDALHLSRRDVHAARRDIFGGFVEAQDNGTHQLVPFQETSLRLLLDVVTYATSRAKKDAVYAYHYNPDFLRFRDDIRHALSKANRETTNDDVNEE